MCRQTLVILFHKYIKPFFHREWFILFVFCYQPLLKASMQNEESFFCNSLMIFVFLLLINLLSLEKKLDSPESKESTCLLVLLNKNLGRASGTSSICLTVGQAQNGSRTSKNSEILWTLLTHTVCNYRVQKAGLGSV